MAPIIIPVLIVGAGPAGLVLALSLLKNGIRVRIVDKEPIHRPGQRGAGIQPRTQEVFHFLGVLPDVLARASKVVPRRVYKLPGGREPVKTVHMSPPEDPTPSTPYINAVHLGQDSTEAVLRSHLEKYDCTVEKGTELLSFEQSSDHVVAHLVRRVGDTETSEDAVCHWLVGTDGARGIVRKHLGLQFQGETRDEHAVVGEIEVRGLDFDHWHSWGDASSQLLMLRPTENTGCFYMIALGQINHASLVTDRTELVNYVRATTDRDDLEVGEIRWISEFRPNIRMVDTFLKGRVLLAGDAAHVHSPTGGQVSGHLVNVIRKKIIYVTKGLNSSILDSINLGWKLTLVERRLATLALLSTYSEERVPIIAEMLRKTTDLLEKLRNARSNDNTDDVAWKRDGSLKQLGVNYRWSSIVIDERAPYDKTRGPENVYGGAEGEALRAGDRAPDAPGLVPMNPGNDAEPISLFRIYGSTHHTVLAFVSSANDANPFLHVVQKYPLDFVRCVSVYPQGSLIPEDIPAEPPTLLDCDGYAYAGYGISPDHPFTVIVRPDGVVGGIVSGSRGVARYFEKIFDMV